MLSSQTSQETSAVESEATTAEDVHTETHSDVIAAAVTASSVLDDIMKDALTSATSPDVTSPQESDSGSEAEAPDKLEIVEEESLGAESSSSDSEHNDDDVANDETLTSATEAVTSPAVEVTQASADVDSDSESSSSEEATVDHDSSLQIVEDSCASTDVPATSQDDDVVCSETKADASEEATQNDDTNVTVTEPASVASCSSDEVDARRSSSDSTPEEAEREATQEVGDSKLEELQPECTKEDVTSPTSDIVADVTSECALEVTTQNMDCQTEHDPEIMALCAQGASGEADADGDDSAFGDVMSNPRDSFVPDDDFSDPDVDGRTHLRNDDDDVTTVTSADSAVPDSKDAPHQDSDHAQVIEHSSDTLHTNGDVTPQTIDDSVTSSS